MVESINVYSRRYSWYIEPKNKNGCKVLHITSEDSVFEFAYSLARYPQTFNPDVGFVRGVIEEHDWREGDQQHQWAKI